MSIAIPRKYFQVRWYDVLGPAGLGFKKWIPDFKRLQTVQEVYTDLDRQHGEIRRASLDIESMREKFEDSYWNYHDRFVARLASLIVKTQAAVDPFARLEKLLDRHYLEIFISPSTMADAFDLIEEDMGSDFGISPAERQEKLVELEAKMEDLKIKIAELSPAEFFPLVQGSVIQDIRRSFVHYWAGEQKHFCEPINPLLLHIESPDVYPDEKWAYEQLGIGQYINSKVSRQPAPSADYQP